MSNPFYAPLEAPPLDELLAERGRLEALRVSVASPAPPASAPEEPAPQPLTSNERSKNPLRPETLAEVIGQDRAKLMMGKVIAAARRTQETMDHILLVGGAGTGKTTFANVIANELAVPCYQISAPVSLDTLLGLRETMNDRDILFVDEIHMQAIQERRGKTASTEPEVFLQLLEDQMIATPTGMLPYPDITVIGATTDEGMLPDPFIARFPLRPRLDKYDEVQLAVMAVWNAQKLNLRIDQDAALAFAQAARGTPRVVNNYVKNARILADDGLITPQIAAEVLDTLNGVTWDGLDADMQGVLTFLYRRCRRESADGEVRYQASVGTLATAIGKSRDVKAIALRIEPYLIEQGYLQVGHGGRTLTDAGVARAQQLLTEVGE